MTVKQFREMIANIPIANDDYEINVGWENDCQNHDGTIVKIVRDDDNYIIVIE